MDLGLAGKKAIVTGGSRGIGMHIIQSLLDEGTSVATCARGKDALDAKLGEWRADGKTVHGEALDVNDADAFDAWLDKSVEALGGVDIFVSNVTTLSSSQGLDRWDDSFNVNLLQHVRATNKLVPHLPKGGDGSIVYIASIAANMNTNMPTETEYGAMKAALVSYAAQTATRLGPDNIRVNAVSRDRSIMKTNSGKWWKRNNRNCSSASNPCQYSTELGRLRKWQMPRCSWQAQRRQISPVPTCELTARPSRPLTTERRSETL